MRTPLIAALVMLICGEALASPPLELALSPLRSYAMPGALSLAGATFGADGQGRTLILGQIGAELDMRCMIIAADDQGATSYAYQYRSSPTQCAGAASLPDGGLLLRASSVTLPEDEAPGVTARLDAQGALVWEVHDSALVQAAPSGEGGTGEFMGAWAGPHPAIAYSAARQRVLGFTYGELRVGQLARSLVQAHAVGDERGELLVSGQSFGSNGLGTLDALRVSRDEAQDFLLQVSDEQGVGATFYRYDGRRRINLIRPLDQDWSQRQVRPMAQAGAALALLWRPQAGDAGDWRVTLVDERGALIWEQALGTAPEEAGLGEPLGIWAGERELALIYLRAEGPLVKVLDVASGQELVAAQALDTLTARTPLGLLPGAGGALTLLSLDTRAGRLHEDKLVLVEAQRGDMDEPADMGAGELEPEAPAASPEDGCGCAGAGAATPAPWALVGLWWIGGRARRRAAKALARGARHERG